MVRVGRVAREQAAHDRAGGDGSRRDGRGPRQVTDLIEVGQHRLASRDDGPAGDAAGDPPGDQPAQFGRGSEASRAENREAERGDQDGVPTKEVRRLACHARCDRHGHHVGGEDHRGGGSGKVVEALVVAIERCGQVGGGKDRDDGLYHRPEPPPSRGSLRLPGHWSATGATCRPPAGVIGDEGMPMVRVVNDGAAGSKGRRCWTRSAGRAPRPGSPHLWSRGRRVYRRARPRA
jgi:hypothetical protein